MFGCMWASLMSEICARASGFGNVNFFGSPWLNLMSFLFVCCLQIPRATHSEIADHAFMDRKG